MVQNKYKQSVYVLMTADNHCELLGKNPIWTTADNYEANRAYSQIILTAKDEAEARESAARDAGEEGAAAWLHESTSVRTIEEYLAQEAFLTSRSND